MRQTWRVCGRSDKNGGDSCRGRSWQLEAGSWTRDYEASTAWGVIVLRRVTHQLQKSSGLPTSPERSSAYVLRESYCKTCKSRYSRLISYCYYLISYHCYCLISYYYLRRDMNDVSYDSRNTVVITELSWGLLMAWCLFDVRASANTMMSKIGQCMSACPGCDIIVVSRHIHFVVYEPEAHTQD